MSPEIQEVTQSMDSSLIHIGYHKTGTTFFQARFYPRVRNAAYIDRKIIQRELLAVRPICFSAEKFTQLVKSITHQRFTICDEDLSGNILSGGLHGYLTKEIGLRLKECFPDAHIVIFIRNQITMIASVYAFYVQGGGTQDVNRFLFNKSDYVTPFFEYAHFDYQSVIEFYHRLYGMDRTHVFCYEDFAQDNRAFLEQYSSQFNLQVDLDEIEISVVNPGLGAPAVKLKQLVNLLTREGRQPKRYLLHIPWLAGKLSGAIARYSRLRGKSRSHARDILGSSNIQYICDYYAESNRALASLLDLPLAQYDYPGFRTSKPTHNINL